MLGPACQVLWLGLVTTPALAVFTVCRNTAPAAPFTQDALGLRFKVRVRVKIRLGKH